MKSIPDRAPITAALPKLRPSPFHAPLLPVALLALSLASGCRNQPSSTPAPEPLPTAQVRVQSIESKSRDAIEEAVGTVRSKLRAAVEAKVSGRVDKITAAPGQWVKSGELLVQLDAREIQARLDQSAALLHQMESEIKRFLNLLQQQAVTQAEFDAIQARHRIAAASLAEAEATLANTRITAPFDGVVTRKWVEVGDLAAPGRTLIEIEDPSSLRLEADVPEGLVDFIKLGAEIQVHPGGAGQPWRALVGEITPVADPASRTFRVKLDLPPNTGLRPGQFARALIPVGESRALRIPASALIQRGQLEFIFIAANNRAALRLVKTGKRVGDEIELVSGAAAGEQVITSAAESLRDGQPIQAQP